MKYKRILLKISGEMIMGAQPFGIDPVACRKTAEAIKSVRDEGVQVGLVIGGGNIFRGMSSVGKEMERVAADQIGMLATIMNGIALQQALDLIGCKARVMSALECPKAVENFNARRAREYLGQGDVVIFVGGTGNPYFTTDTAAALRASEIQADLLMKATKVDGIYDRDPKVYPEAVKYQTISYTQALEQRLQIMDAAAFALCSSNSIPIFVFNMQRLGIKSLKEILNDIHHGTYVKEE